MAVGLPAGAVLMAAWFLRLVAKLDSVDMAMTIRSMRQRGFVGWELALGGILIAGVLAFIAVSRMQVANCRADLAEFRRAYDVLSVQVQTQAAAMGELERKGKEAAARGATARSQAQPVVEAAQKSADALAGAMRGLRPAECQAAGAVKVVRDDLGATLR